MRQNCVQNVVRLCLILLLTTASGLVYADNDNLQNATLITATPFIDTIDNSAFGQETGEPCDGGYAGSFWYTYTPPENTNLVVRAVGLAEMVDPVLGLHTGNDFPLQEIYCGDLDNYGSENTTTDELFFLPVTGNTNYKIQVQSNQEQDRGINEIQIITDSVANGANDFADAIAIVNFPFFDVVDNTGFDNESADANCGAGSFWYRYTPTASGELRLEAYARDDTVVGIYTGESLGSLNEEICSDTDLLQNGELLTFPVQSGVTYSILIASYSDSTTRGQHFIEITGPDGAAADNVGDNPVGSSPIRPPEEVLGQFVVDEGPGLDGLCKFRSDGPIIAEIPIPAVVNPAYIGVDGLLTDPAKLIQNGVIGSTATVRFAAFDIDSNTNVPDIEPEWDLLSFNNQSVVIPGGLVGEDGKWRFYSFEVPVERIRFNQVGSTDIKNLFQLSIDFLNIGIGEYWCTAVDWVSIELDLAAPYVLAHGINADKTTWEEDDAPGVLAELDDIGVRYTRFTAGKNGRSIDNARLLITEIAGYLAEVNSRKVHIIAHSKGGLDSQYIQALNPDEFDIVSLSTLSTPHLGSVAGDATLIKLELANSLQDDGSDPNGYVEAFLNSPNVGPELPGVKDLTIDESKSALASDLRGNIKNTFTIGADADVNGDNELNISEDSGLFPPLLDWYSDESWLLMRDFSSVKLLSVRSVPGTLWGTNKALVYESRQVSAPQANDIVVTVNSANPAYGTVLLKADAANHGTVKSAANINRILRRTIPLK